MAERPDSPAEQPGAGPQRATRLDEVDEASVDSFPASDPPSFVPVTHPGVPAHGEETPSEEDET